VAPHFERIAQAFYDRTREHEEAHAVFADEAQITRLQHSLVRWMHRVFQGPHDESYFDQTLRIGRVHARLELPQRFMFSAMTLIRLELQRLAIATFGEAASPTSEAIHRALDLELAVMLESYRADTMARLTAQERETSLADQRTQHRIASAVELASIAIVALDVGGHVVLFNREAERVTGRTREEVAGCSFTELVTTGEDPFAIAVRDVLASPIGTRHTTTSALRTRAGKQREMRWELVRTSETSSHAAGDVAALAIGTDITGERVAAERHRQQEKLAAVGTLAAGLAHEIRNPLNGAQLHLAFLERALKKAANSEELLEPVRVVADEVKRLALLVTEFLDFARPNPLTLKQNGARAIAERVRALVAGKASAAGVQLSLDLPPREVEFVADANKIEQVVINLLQNAIEAVSGQNGGTVTLRARQKPREVLFEIEDDGPGISRPDAPIFDAFYSTKPSGTGLGLSICHRIVTDHGGEISVESRPGQTVFRFTIPTAIVREGT
jgi:PAS domain S-box-containing protein